ncbi:MAG TPA: hypothetical protein VEA59_06040 [Patescibacteria group bacterium]|nr:hypothetical protein [Patescibacteria group bacterium]
MRKREIYFSWEAPQFRYYEKNFGWYLTLGVVVLLLSGYMFIQADYFGAASFLIIGALIFWLSRVKPRTIVVELSDKGIHLDDVHIPYKQIEFFWVVDNAHHSTLNLHTTSTLQKLVIIQLESQDPDEIRDFLLELVPEHHETTETITQAIAHKFKF